MQKNLNSSQATCMKLNDKFYSLEIIDTQQILIDKQHESIKELVSKSVEQESIINEIMRGR